MVFEQIKEAQKRLSIMAPSGSQVFKMRNPYDSSSGEVITNPEVGLMGILQEYGDTKADLADMQRLGKKQEFDVGVTIFSRSPFTKAVQRNFNLIATLGFISIYRATWESVLV
jgi:hypothetical protein